MSFLTFWMLEPCRLSKFKMRVLVVFAIWMLARSYRRLKVAERESGTSQRVKSCKTFHAVTLIRGCAAFLCASFTV
jgi:hypothetical protein